jgi:cob(I)alamin adenosyltransferase
MQKYNFFPYFCSFKNKNDMSKIYTKTGDKGMTSLADGTRVSKTSELLEAYGTIDELNAQIALFLATSEEPFLEDMQHQLFVVGGMLATPADKWTEIWPTINLESYIATIEQEIDRLSAQLEPLKSFIILGGNTPIAQLHVCRTVCRRSERTIAQLAVQNERYFLLLQFANRLADYLFILARFYHKKMNIPETYWKSIK